MLFRSGKDLHQVTHRHHTTQGLALYTYRYAPQLPLRATDDAVLVNWCEITITTEEGTCRTTMPL